MINVQHEQQDAQRDHPKTVNSNVITERLQLVSTNFLGPIPPGAVGGIHYMTKYTDSNTRLKDVHFVKERGEAELTLTNVTQDLAVLLRLSVNPLRSDNGAEPTSRIVQDYCKPTEIAQTSLSPYTRQQNGLSERDGLTAIAITGYFLNEEGVSLQLWGEISATAISHVNRPPPKALEGHTPNVRMVGKQASYHS